MSDFRYTSWRGIVRDVPPEDRLTVAERAIGRGDLAPAEAAQALSAIWRMLDMPLRERSAEQWLALWRTLGAFAVGGRLSEAERPCRPLVLYRGAKHADRRGLSWSPLQLVAWHYADLRGGTVYAAEVAPAAMLAAIKVAGAAWQEIVVDPAELELRPVGTLEPSIADHVRDREAFALAVGGRP